VFEKHPLLGAKFTLHKQGEHDAFIVRRHVTVQLGFVLHVHSYIKQSIFCFMLVLVFNGLCSLPNQQRFLKHLSGVTDAI